MLLPITPARFDPRLDRVRSAMRDHGAAALIVAENGRTRYLTGYQRYFTGTHVAPVHAVLVTPRSGPFLLMPRHISLRSDEHAAARIVPLAAVDGAMIDSVAALLEETGMSGGPLAVEFDFANHRFLERLAARLGRPTLVDAAAIMRQATAIKFPEEIASIRAAARLVDLGVGAAVEAIRPGVSELDVAAEASAAMLRGGAEFINHMTIRSGPHAAANHPVPTSRIIAEGDCVQIDLGCIHDGYASDINRTVIAGTPSAEQARLLEVGQAMLESGLAAVRPGASAAAVWRATFAVAERAGMADRVIMPYAGHGIGLSLHEQPFVNASADSILEENMVLALEPGVYAPGIGCSRPEDMVLVTAAGHEVLTHYPRDHDLMLRRQSR